MARHPWLSALAILALLRCGGGGDTANFNVEPESITMAVGDRIALTARPGADLASDLEWEVEDTYGGGLRNTVGLNTEYFAPEKAGDFHIAIRAVRSDGRRLKQTVIAHVLPVPTVSPTYTQVSQGGFVDFTADMRGLARNTVKWSLNQPSAGEIDENGRFRPSRAGTFQVIATSTLDPTVTAEATVVVD